MPSQVIGVVEINRRPCLEFLVLRDGKPFRTARVAIQAHVLEAVRALPEGTIIEIEHTEGQNGMKGFQTLRANPNEPK